MFRCRNSVVIIAVCALAGCSTARPQTIDDQARAYVRLAVALGEHNPDSLDFYSGPPQLVEAVRQALPSLDDIGRDADALSRTAAGDSPRAREIADGARLIAERVQVLRGAGWSYELERRLFFAIDAPPLDSAAVAAARAQLETTLPGRGRLVDRFAEATRPLVVAADRWPSVLRAALDECRRRTRAHIDLGDERVEVELVRDRPWAAYSRYRGSRRSVIQVNADFQFTVDQLLQLACHEGYPGHHTRSSLLDDGRAEHAVQLTFSPASMASEAAAMAATDLAFSTDERAQFERERLAPLAGISGDLIPRGVAIERLVARLQPLQSQIAADFIDGRLEFSRTVDALEKEALVPHAEALVKYINEYRSYVATYTDGAQLFDARLRGCVEAGVDPWRCYERALR